MAWRGCNATGKAERAAHLQIECLLISMAPIDEHRDDRRARLARCHLEHTACFLVARADILEHFGDHALDGGNATLFLDDALQQQKRVLGRSDAGLQQQAVHARPRQGLSGQAGPMRTRRGIKDGKT